MTSKTQLILQTLQRANNIVNNVDIKFLKIAIGPKMQPIIVVDTTKNFRIDVIEKAGDLSLLDIKPTKYRHGAVYDNSKTEFLTADEVNDRLIHWLVNFSSITPIPELNLSFDNSLFQTIIIIWHQKGFLWCNMNLESYTQQMIDDRLMFNNEIEGLIQAGKENAKELTDAIEKMPEGSLIENEGTWLLKSKSGPIPIDKLWYDQEINDFGVEKFKSDYGETCHGILIKIFDCANITREQIETIIKETIEL